MWFRFFTIAFLHLIHRFVWLLNTVLFYLVSLTTKRFGTEVPFSAGEFCGEDTKKNKRVFQSGYKKIKGRNYEGNRLRRHSEFS